MADEQAQQPRAPEFKSEPSREGGLPWAAVGIGFVALAILVALVVLLSHKPQRQGAGAPSPYAAHIQLQNVKLSQAENFVGGTVTFIEGLVTNNGDKTVTRGTVEIVLQNPAGDIAQQEEVPLQVLDRAGPYPQAIDLRLSPLKPQQQREFRLTLSSVASDWNRQIPKLTVMQVETQ